jgi:DNA-binding response OmpR family regulator
LIVEDERAFRSALAMALSDEGFEVATASNGAVALELLDDIEPRAIVLDLNMPVLDGFGFAEAYRKRPGPPAPVIICTTRRADSRVRSIGARALLSKPVDIDELVDVVKQCAS